MLRDLLTSFPLSKVTRIDRRYLGQMRVMVKYCKKLNEQVKDLPSLHLAEDVIQSVTDVLSRAITKPSSKEEKARKLEVGGEFERAESFDNDFGIERNQDSKSSENAEWRKDTLKEKLSILNNKPKRTLEFWVWEPYIPPMASEADQKYVSRRQLTFEEDMNFATALVYFLAELKKNPLSHWSGSVLDSPLFYAKFPVTQAELSRKGGRIPALNILSTISDLVTASPVKSSTAEWTFKHEERPTDARVLRRTRANRGATTLVLCNRFPTSVAAATAFESATSLQHFIWQHGLL
uniref:Uncharacterized protein n=1 Tax=Candolleomyces aberdarensis TaxID=2316362 RepID=A0A4Q2D4S1_9AGAR